ncbi:hypothetical protein ACENW9_000809 [Escherichia coli]
MFRYRRVNVDGKSITETFAAGEAVQPGKLVKLVDGVFVNAADAEGRLYIVNPAYHEGKGIGDTIEAGETVVADYVEEGREFAFRLEAGAYVKDQAIKLGDVTVGFCQENITLEDVDFVRVRIA